jgi:RNA polymerase sigma-70 factor (ECF subfamily)
MPIQDTLPSLISRIAEGDHAAFDRLYRATCAHLYSVSHRLLRNEARAEETLQEAYVSIWSNAVQYDSAAGTPMTWMINIVRNKAIDQMRSHRAERKSTVGLDDEAMSVPAPASSEPPQLFDSAFIKARIDMCMRALPARQRQALVLAYYRGLIHTDIALALDAPLGTAKGWVRQGLDQLRYSLEDRKK